MPASYIIIDDTHFNARPYFLYQYIPHHSPDGIILENIKFNMDMLPGFSQFPQQGLQHGSTAGISLYTVAVKRKRLGCIAK